MKKKVSVLFLTAMFTLLFSVVAQAKTIPQVNNVSEAGTVSAIDSREVVISSDTNANIEYTFQLNVACDSWVCLSGNHSTALKNDYSTNKVSIFTDSAMTNLLEECEFGWLNPDSKCMWMKKGTYYVKIHNSSLFDFKGKVNILAYAIPIEKVFNVTTNVSKNKVTVSMNNVLGTLVDYVEYQKGSVSLSNVGSQSYWKTKVVADIYNGNDNAYVLKSVNEKYSFTAKTNGYYTIMIQSGGARYSKVIKVSGIDTKKPTVKGIKNKKTYKKAVKITFKDASGIKKATLNGKKIKSGKKVKNNGSYKLKVTDKAGNTRVVKFKVKIKRKK